MRYITDMRVAKANNLVVFEIAFSNLQFWETVALLDTKPSLPFGNQHAVIEQNFTVKGLQIRRILWWKQCHIFNGVRAIAPPVRVRVWFRVRVRYRIGAIFLGGNSVPIHFQLVDPNWRCLWQFLLSIELWIFITVISFSWES